MSSRSERGRANRRAVAAGSLSFVLLVVAALTGTAIIAAILAASGATDVRVGAALVIAVVGGAVAGTAWWLTRSVVPRVGGDDYQAPPAAWTRSVVLGAVTITALLAGASTAGGGLVEAGLWLLVVGTGGALGVRFADPARSAP